MKKTFLSLIFCAISLVTFSAYLEKLPMTLTQPDGAVINCFATGDEFYNWAHDADGYTIIQAPNGYYYYAEQDGNHLKPSVYLVNSVDPASVGITKWVKISKQAYQQKMNARSNAQSAYQSKPSFAPHTGVMNNLVVYIRFFDDVEFTTKRQTYDTNLNATTGVALKSYFNEVSYNKLTISSTHYPNCPLTTNFSYQDSHPRKYFQPYNATANPTGYTTDAEKTTREHTLLVDAVNWINANSPVPTSLNIDGDGDGKVDNVCFVIKGNSGAWNDLLWAHRWSLYTQTVNINGKRVYGYTFQPENQVAVKTLCHEMFHALGSPDLYHYTNQGDFVPVGSWDLMESGGAHMLTYMKWKYSKQTWISSIPEITTTGTYTINPSTSATNNCFKIASPNSTNEFFVVEYREKTGTFETNIPGSGLLIYRIDARLNGNADGPPDEIYLYRQGGSKTVNGDVKMANFSSTVYRTAMGDATDPVSFLQDGSAGGLHISNIQAANGTMTFTVTFPAVCTPPTVQASAFTSSSVSTNSMNIGWTRGNGTSVVVLARKGSAVNEDPINGTDYTADPAFGLGSEIGTGNFVVYKGNGNSATISALLQGSSYCYAIYECNSVTNCYSVPALTANVSTIGIQPTKTLDYKANKAQSVLGTYVDLGTNGTVIATANFDDANSAVQNIGFPFVYNDQVFSQFVLNTNGFIKLGDTPPSTAALFYNGVQSQEGGIFNSPKATDVNLIIPLNNDLTAGTNTPEYRVYTSGVAPKRVCTIQFKNLKDKTSLTQLFDNLQFQIKLYETTKMIEFVYGDWAATTNTSNYETAACGLKGINNTASQLLSVTKSSTATWDKVTFANANYSTTGNTMNFGNPTARPKPDAGRIFRFNSVPDSVINIGEIHALADASKFFSNPQVISVNIINAGKNNQTNIPVVLTSSGANSFSGTKCISNLNAGDTAKVAFADFNPTNNGTTNIYFTLPNDVYNVNNQKVWIQNTNDYICNYSTADNPLFSLGGTNAITYYAKYHVSGCAKVSAVNAFIPNNAASTASIGKTVFGVLLDDAGAIIYKSPDYTIQQSDIGLWHSFPINTSSTITNADYYAGFGLNASASAYLPMGVQSERPIRPNTYYHSKNDGSELTAENPSGFFYRYMIGATLSSVANGIEQLDNNSIKVYPNPISTELYIEIKDCKGKVDFDIINSIGQVVYSGIVLEKTVVQTSTFRSGVYLLKLKNGNSYKSEKIVKY